MASTWGPAPSTSEQETMWRALCLSTFLTHMLKVNKHCCLKLLRPGLVCCEAIATETMGGSPRMTLLELKACGDTLGEEGITGRGQQLILQPLLRPPLMSHLFVQISRGLFSGGFRVSDGRQQPMCQMEQKAGQSAPFRVGNRVQSVPCDPMDCSLPGSSVHGISQAGILQWSAISLLQEILLTQELNPHLPCVLHCRQILFH